jgi:glyoxylase-like metal-dependent hydrolase (beta-lactamase superfamily II)
MNSLRLNLSTLVFLFCLNLLAQNPDDVNIEAIQMSDHVYMLTGSGGNIGISIGDDGVFVIDDQYAVLTPKILTAIRKLSDKPIQYLVNTHWHGDHTGGNANMAKEGATIMAHDNVRKRLVESPMRDQSKRPAEALPVITFSDQLNLHMNGEQIAIFHVENAHTDGDALIYFTESNVLHTGDNYFNGLYPYVDLNSGGSVNGYIDAVERSLMLIDDETKIIPGHGPASNKKEYSIFLNMLKEIRENVLAEIANGKSEDDVSNNSAITKTYDDLGYSWRFISSEKIRRTVYKSLKNNSGE